MNYHIHLFSDTGYRYCMKTLLHWYEWGHSSHAFTSYLSIALEIVEYIEWARGVKGECLVFTREKAPIKIGCSK